MYMRACVCVSLPFFSLSFRLYLHAQWFLSPSTCFFHGNRTVKWPALLSSKSSRDTVTCLQSPAAVSGSSLCLVVLSVLTEGSIFVSSTQLLSPRDRFTPAFNSNLAWIPVLQKYSEVLSTSSLSILRVPFVSHSLVLHEYSVFDTWTASSKDCVCLSLPKQWSVLTHYFCPKIEELLFGAYY